MEEKLHENIAIVYYYFALSHNNHTKISEILEAVDSTAAVFFSHVLNEMDNILVGLRGEGSIVFNEVKSKIKKPPNNSIHSKSKSSFFHQTPLFFNLQQY